MIRCTCCQTELTAPQFYNGHPYGSTCIKRVDPSQKVSKVVYVACEEWKILSEGQRSVVKVKVGGKWSQVVAYGDIHGRTTTTYMQDGVMYIAEGKV